MKQILLILSLTILLSAQKTSISSAKIYVSNDQDSTKLRLNSFVELKIQNYNWLKSDTMVESKVKIYINGFYFRSLPIRQHQTVDNITTLVFKLERNDENREDWKSIFHYPWHYSKELSFKVADESSARMSSEAANNLTFKLFSKTDLWITSGLLLFMLIFLFILAKKTPILKDFNKTIALEDQHFSLSRTQFAFWMFIITFSFLFIWLVSGSTASISGSTLTLLGISVITSVTATSIDQSRKPMPTGLAVLPSKSDGFLFDILSDSEGVNIHRFQMIVWTLIMGFVFVKNVLVNLDMPQFDENLLAVMGISSGTYVGLKIPENKRAEENNSEVANSVPQAPKDLAAGDDSYPMG